MPKTSKTPSPKPSKKKPFVYKSVAGDKVPEFPEENVFYVDEKTGACAFVDPSSKKPVQTALSFLKVKVTKKDPLTLSGKINLNPSGSDFSGDFSGCKSWTIKAGEVSFAKK